MGTIRAYSGSVLLYSGIFRRTFNVFPFGWGSKGMVGVHKTTVEGEDRPPGRWALQTTSAL